MIQTTIIKQMSNAELTKEVLLKLRKDCKNTHSHPHIYVYITKGENGHF